MSERKKSRRPPLWVVSGLLFFIACINYFDRQSLSVVAPRIQAELHLTDRGYGHAVSGFLFASAIAYALSGFISDWLGARRSLALFVAWWSLAEAATAFVTSGLQLVIARFCLGLGEPGLWVAAPKATSETVSEDRRSLVIGLYTGGAAIGAVIALPIIIWIVTRLPYRSIFLLDGVAGLLWLPLWWILYRYEAPKQPMQSARSGAALRAVLTNPATWRLALARAVTDPVWYFYLFWYPKYLLSARHMTLAQTARIGWLVYVGAAVGTLAAGLFSTSLIRRGMQVLKAYRWTMLAAALMIPLSPLVALSRSNGASAGFASVVAFAHMCWLVTLTSIIVEIFPQEQVGRAAGLIAAGSGFGGMISSEFIAWLVVHSGYAQSFWWMAMLHPIAFCVLWKVYAGRSDHSPITAKEHQTTA